MVHSDYIMREENVKFQSDEIRTKFDTYINDLVREVRYKNRNKEYVYKL